MALQAKANVARDAGAARGAPLLSAACAVVLGAGASGVAAARLLAAAGCRVRVLDEDAEAAEGAAARLALPDVTFRGGAAALPGDPFELCVTSPGFAGAHPWLAACAARGIPIVSELELGFSHWRGRLLAVTGSKGKSSLVKLCADTLNRAGLAAAPAGNYGTPLCELALDRPDLDWAVTEVSSFQLEHVRLFRPRIGVLLNLQPDHLDRHGSMDDYRRLKLRLFACQQAGDTALLPEGFDDGGAVPSAAERLVFGNGSACDWRYAGGSVTGRRGGRDVCVPVAGTWFDNPVLGPAAAAGVAVLAACGLDADAMAAGFRAFEPLPHRLQTVADIGGVRYVDDSKATSLSALAAALRMLPGPVRLIAGGRLKEPVSGEAKELLTRRVRKVYVIGECMRELCAAWGRDVTCDACGDLRTAVVRAAAEACAGETVLLSPGCASFDQFRNYRERGERFARLVREVAATRETSNRSGG
jgi:UDP-N-acetylmuramoylalanine--D-glutamate ligase